jgi:hypothetical protein
MEEETLTVFAAASLPVGRHVGGVGTPASPLSLETSSPPSAATSSRTRL